MKRLLLVLFTGLLLNMHVFAQWDDFNYDDYNDDYDSDVLSSTDASGTTNFTIKNSGAEDQTEQKLTLPNSQPIYLYFYNSVQNPNTPEPTAQPVEPAPPPPKEQEPIIEYRYIPAPVFEPPPPSPPPPSPPPQVEYRYIQPPPSQVEYIYIQPSQPQPQVEYIYVQPPTPEPVYAAPLSAPPPMQIRVIPGLPDPNSPRILRIQVGSYAVHNTADIMAQRIRAIGLQADIEYYNSLKRVIVPGVRAADACTIVQMLESLGFTEVWIRE